MLRLAPLLFLVLSACSLSGPSDADIEAARSPEAEGVIVNRTSADVVVYAMDDENAALFDPASEFDISDLTTVIASGEARALPITGYESDEDFIVYVFRVNGRRATYGGFARADGTEFERDDAVFILSSF